MAAAPTDPRLARRTAALAAARAVGAPRSKLPFGRARAPMALGAAPAPRRTLTDPFEDPAAPPRAPAAAEPAEERVQPAAPPPPVARETPPAPAPAARPAPAPAPKATPGSLDDLMATAVQNPPPKGKSELDKRLAGIDEAGNERDTHRKQEAAPSVHNLTRSEIQAAMKAVQPRVNDCGRQFQASGAAELKVTVGEDGAVKSVNVTGVFAGTPTAECLQRAVKSAAFPPSTGLRFDYPISLR
jgi:outer membrane biosynthesis protein TonB